MSNITRFAAGGIHCVQCGEKMPSGYFGGFAGLTIADEGEVSGMRRVLGAVTAPSPNPQRNMVYPRHDDGYGKPFNFEGQPENFGLVFEAMDKDLKNFLIGTLLYTVGEWDFSAGGVQGQNYRDTLWLLSQEGYSMEPDSFGQPGFNNMLVWSASFSVDEGDMAFQAVSDVIYTGAPAKVQKTAWGVSMITAFGKLAAMTSTFFSQFVPTMVSVIGDGSLTAIPLPNTPISVAKTQFWNFNTGAALTTSAVNTSSPAATVSAALADGIPYVGLFETTDY